MVPRKEIEKEGERERRGEKLQKRETERNSF